MICIYTIGNIERDPLSQSPSCRNSGNVKIWKPISTDLKSWIQSKCWAMKCQGWRMTILGIGQNQGKNATVSKNKKNQWWPFGSKKKEKNKISNSILMLLELLPILHPKLDLVFCLFLHKFCDHIYLEVIKLLLCTNLKKNSWFPILCLTFFLTMRSFFWYTIFGGRHFFLFFWRGNVDFFSVKVHTYRKVKITFVTKEESARKWGTDKKALLWPKSDQKVQNGQKTL